MAERIQVIDGAEVRRRRRFDRRDWKTVAEYIKGEADRRRRDEHRKHLEKVWKEVDRQLRMEPDLAFKTMENGQKDPRKGWMPEMELPLQSQTLEMITADARRMLKPDSGAWFSAMAAVTDDWLQTVEVDLPVIAAGDSSRVDSRFTQADADRLVEGWLNHWHRQYDFWMTWDHLNAEALKYGTFIGRARNVTKSIVIETARGVSRQQQRFPVLFPCPIKETLLDDRPMSVLHEGTAIGPAVIRTKKMRFEDIAIAAKDGKSDPDDEDGGWMAAALEDVKPDKSGEVEVMEYEGDLVVPRKVAGSFHLPNAITTLLVDKGGPRVIRHRWRQTPYSSYLVQPYHVEDIKSPYGVGPLMKGMPVAKAATEALNRVMQAAILNTEPPVGYDPDDPHFVSQGGPVIEPRAQWATLSEVKPVEIGDLTALQAVYIALVQQYYDVTGVNQPRLGQVTRSHTTAFAKDAELSRGVVRTVDYANTVIDGPLTRWLYMAYDMAMKITRPQMVYLDTFGAFVELSARQLPANAAFTAFGAGGPLEKREKQAARLQALIQAGQIDQIKIQLGGQPLDYERVQKELLREGGWTDVDQFFAATGPAGVQGAAAPAAAIPPALITSRGAADSLVA